MATKRTTPTKRKTSSPKPGGAKKNAATKAKNVAKRAAKPAAKNAVKPAAPIKPRPLDDDEIELSGVFGRVRFKESDPFAEQREIFDHYDRDKDGVISPHELARVLEALGMELEEHELKVALLDIDHDGDEKIGWDEFVSWWRSMRG